MKRVRTNIMGAILVYAVLTMAPVAVLAASLNLSSNGSDTGGWLVSVPSNLFVSTGAVYDDTLGWVQKSSDGLSSMHGSGPAGFRVYMQSNPQGTVFTPKQVMLIDYNGATSFSGSVQINTDSTANQPTCDASKLGTFWYKSASTDTVQVCAKVNNVPTWRTLSLN
jgi:hypothetical protein